MIFVFFTIVNANIAEDEVDVKLSFTFEDLFFLLAILIIISLILIIFLRKFLRYYDSEFL